MVVRLYRKSMRWIDGKLTMVITDENDNIVRNLTKEQIKGLKISPEKDGRSNPRRKEPYNSTNTCDRCGIDFDIATGNRYREYDKEGNWTGKWLCKNCYDKERYKNGDTTCNLIKKMTDRRTGNLDPNSNNAKGDNFEELTCRWRSMVSTIPVENLNIKNDNYSTGTPIDHSRDSELGIIQTKGRFYNSRNGLWSFAGFEREYEKEFDNMICYCASKDGKMIERLYIFPKKEIKDRTCVGIYKNPSRHEPWYEQYRVKDEKTLESVNKIWKDIIE